MAVVSVPWAVVVRDWSLSLWAHVPVGKLSMHCTLKGTESSGQGGEGPAGQAGRSLWSGGMGTGQVPLRARDALPVWSRGLLLPGRRFVGGQLVGPGVVFHTQASGAPQPGPFPVPEASRCFCLSSSCGRWPLRKRLEVLAKVKYCSHFPIVPWWAWLLEAHRCSGTFEGWALGCVGPSPCIFGWCTLNC